uniref:Peptidase M16 C-terminal domain-containing protein n=1 Tax=Plectus sambesii TaxID=2011161 RepID=A0A914VHF9_9BILA
MLPVYMDHLLCPTLTDEQFATEVHHINGEGEDAGVVYCEMQDYESDISQLVSWKCKELFYPDKCSYRVETGGRLENLRSSCTNEKVRHFHRRFYDPCNMTVIVCGQINHEQVLAAVESVEERILQDPQRSEIRRNFVRPFRSP